MNQVEECSPRNRRRLDIELSCLKMLKEEAKRARMELKRERQAEKCEETQTYLSASFSGEDFEEGTEERATATASQTSVKHCAYAARNGSASASNLLILG